MSEYKMFKVADIAPELVGDVSDGKEHGKIKPESDIFLARDSRGFDRIWVDIEFSDGKFRHDTLDGLKDKNNQPVVSIKDFQDVNHRLLIAGRPYVDLMKNINQIDESRMAVAKAAGERSRDFVQSEPHEKEKRAAIAVEMREFAKKSPDFLEALKKTDPDFSVLVSDPSKEDQVYARVLEINAENRKFNEEKSRDYDRRMQEHLAAERAAVVKPAQAQPQQQEKPAFRHDINKNQAVATVEATKAIPKNIEALQKVPGTEKHGAEDMKALAYQRGLIQERDKNLPPAEQAGKLAKFDNLAATNLEFVKHIRELSAEEKPVDRWQQRDTGEQSL